RRSGAPRTSSSPRRAGAAERAGRRAHPERELRSVGAPYDGDAQIATRGGDRGVRGACVAARAIGEAGDARWRGVVAPAEEPEEGAAIGRGVVEAEEAIAAQARRGIV